MAQSEQQAATALNHTPLEDAIGLFSGIVLCSLSMHVLGAAGLLTGQTAGAALLIAHVAELDIGLVFFLVNLPFYAFAALRMGWSFTLRTFAAVAALSALTSFAPTLLPLGAIEPITAAIGGAVLAAAGLVILFRHRASLGGIGIMGLYLQDKTGFQADWFQMIVDAVIFLTAMLFLDPMLVFISCVGAVALNLIVALNHRSDRYIAR